MGNNDHSSQGKELVEKSQGKLSTMSTGNLVLIAVGIIVALVTGLLEAVLTIVAPFAVGIILYYAYQSWSRDKEITANKHSPLPQSEGSIPFSGHDSTGTTPYQH